jgi:hypothetical protein
MSFPGFGVKVILTCLQAVEIKTCHAGSKYVTLVWNYMLHHLMQKYW